MPGRLVGPVSPAGDTRAELWRKSSGTVTGHAAIASLVFTMGEATSGAVTITPR